LGYLAPVIIAAKILLKEVWSFRIEHRDERAIFTRIVKGYTRFVGKYITGRRKRFRPHKVYIFPIRITSRVDLAMSVCPSVLMNAEISETIRATIVALGMQIPEIPAQRKFSGSGSDRSQSDLASFPELVPKLV